MRCLLLLALVVVLAPSTLGCKKLKTKDAPSPTTPAPGSEQVGAHAPTGVVTSTGTGGGGSGGAVQAVRKAAGRAVSQNELNNIRLFIETASGANGQMPSVREVEAALQREAPATYKLIQEKAIILTGTRSREGIWAYTADAQSTTGEHLIIQGGAVQRMDPQTLRQRLQQGG